MKPGRKPYLTPEIRKAHDRFSHLRSLAKRRHRKCGVEGCGRPTQGRPYCENHGKRRRNIGHVSMRKRLSYKELRGALTLCRAYLRIHPPPPEIVHTLTSEILEPTADYLITNNDGWREWNLVQTRARLRLVMEWWRDPASAKVGSRGWRQRRNNPQDVLAVLLSVTLYTDEREWGKGFAPEMARAAHLVKLRKLRRRTYTSRTGKTYTDTVRISGVVYRLLGQVIAEKLGTWLLLTTRAIHTWQPPRKPRPAPPAPPMHWTLPPRTSRPLYRALGDLKKISEWQRHEALWEQYPDGRVPLK